MGNSTSSPSSEPQRVASSTPSTKPPPIRKDDPLPATASIDGISVGSSQGCSECILTVTQGISSSAAKIYRNQTMISSETCNRFNVDVQSVKDKKLSIETFKRNLQVGTYYQVNNDGTCTKTLFPPEDLNAVTKLEEIPWNKAIKGETKTMTNSPIALSSTKLIIKPNLPFRIFFNGEQIDVKLMTLFHPSPIRVENVQHDAVLTLGDPADANSKLIVMVPLAGSSLPTQTSSFIAKIATYIPGALIANASTGLFEPIDALTGNDWNLSTLLPGSSRNGENVVNVGYFSWETAPKLEAKLRNIVRAPANLPDVHEYGWKPAENSPSLRYIMLKDAVTINSFDLQTIRMLPITSPTDAIQPPLIDTLVYSPPTTCKDKPYDKSCDPFANIPVNKPIDADILWQTLLGIVGIVAMLIGIYFAIKYAADDNWGLWLKNKITGSGTGTSVIPIQIKSPFSISNPLPRLTGQPASRTTTPQNKGSMFGNIFSRKTTPKTPTSNPPVQRKPTTPNRLVKPSTTTTTTNKKQSPITQNYTRNRNPAIYNRAAAGTGLNSARDLADAEARNRMATNQLRGSRSGN